MEFHQKHTSISLSDSFLNCIDLHRFGFNGKEKDDEISGTTGSHLDFGARVYDCRLSRFFAVDPGSSLSPSKSPFCYAGNSPIFFIDEDGKWQVGWRDNNDQSKGIVLVAEPGDNLQTLSVQMGIPYKELINNNFGGDDFTLNSPLEGGEWLRQEDLPGVEVFQNINRLLAEGAGISPDYNCARMAGECAGFDFEMEDKNNIVGIEGTPDQTVGKPYKYSGLAAWGKANTGLFGLISDENKTLGVLEDESKIGDIITYKLNSADAPEWATNGSAHYSIVLLKDKSGQNIQSVFEKSGKRPAQFSNYSPSSSSSFSPSSEKTGRNEHIFRLK